MHQLHGPHLSVTLHRVPSSSSVIDVLDHVLDKGIVVDAWVRVSLAGIDLLAIEARVVVASIATYLTYATAVATLPPVSLYTRARRAPSLGQQLQQVRDRMDGASGLRDLEHRAEQHILDQFPGTGRRHAKSRRNPKKGRRRGES